jgi:hypothetical protein
LIVLGWHLLTRKDVKHLIPFLTEKEWACMTLTSQLAKAPRLGADFSPLRTPVYVYVDEQKRTIHGVLAFLKRGIVVPYWFELGAVRLNGDITGIIRKKEGLINTVLGRTCCVAEIETVIRRSPIEVDYKTMIMNGELQDYTVTPPYTDIEIKQATPDDADRLFDLQEGYEKEEVLIDPARFNPRSCLLHLKQLLEEQLVYYIEFDGLPIAKAGTNALGFEYCQLGGVYTDVRFRNRGIATFLIRYLTRELLRYRKKVTLFVKEENHTAINMYKRCGFSLQEDFRITYYRG